MTLDATVLGIDLATAAARCVALDARSGAVLGMSRRDLPRPARSEGGHSRQSAAYGDVTLQLVEEVCRELPPSAPPVRAVSVTGTSGTVVPTDPAGRPLAPARLYDDTSAAAVLGAPAARRAPTLGRGRLLLDEVADARLLTTADVALSALAGHVVAGDTSHWLKAGIRLSTKDFDESLLDATGVPRDRLPELVGPGTVVGTVDAGVTSRLGLPSGVLLVAGMTDGCTAQISAGAVHDGDTMGVLGTTLVLKAVSAVDVSTPDGAVYSHAGPDGRFWPGGASNSGGGVLAAEFRTQGASALDAAAATHGPATVVRYPLTRDGERFPVADPAMSDLLSGAPRDDVDAYRAVLDGVALVERLGLERLAALGVRSRRHVLAGGGSRSPVWNSIRSALVGPAVAGDDDDVVLVMGAGSALGAALLAVAGATDQTLTSVVDRLVPPAAPVRPDPRTSAAAAKLWERFRHLLAEAGHELPAVPAPTP
jgi:xylulokinase